MFRKRKNLILLILLISLPLTIYISNLEVTKASQPATYDLFSPLLRAYELVKGRYLHFPEVTDQKLLHGAIEGMVEKLEDPYSQFLNREEYQRFNEQLDGEFVGVGIELTIEGDYPLIITPLKGSPADRTGIQAGDLILQIDGESTKGLTLTQVVNKIRGKKGAPVHLKVKHKSGAVEEITVVRDLIVVKSVKAKLISAKIGLIEISSFNTRTPDNLSHILGEFGSQGVKGLIIDLRDNPGGLLYSAIDVASYFIDEGKIINTKSRSGENAYWTRGNEFPNLPLAVLINGGTASASEIVAGAIRSHRMGILVGKKSFGKGVIQDTFKLEDGSAVVLTTSEFFTPTGQKIHRVGLLPDIPVVDEKKDLEKAIDWIKDHLETLCPCPVPSN